MKSKTTENTQAVAVHSFYNGEVEQMIKEVHLEVKDEALVTAVSLAEAKRPQAIDDLHNYSSWITAKFSELKSRVLGKLNIEGLISKGSNLIAFYAQKDEELTSEKTELESKLRAQSKEVEKYPADGIAHDIRTWAYVHFIMLIVCIGEVLSLESAMGSLTGNGVIARIVMSFSVVVSVYFLIKLEVHKAREIKNKITRLLFHIGITVLASVMFYGIAHLRMLYLEIVAPNISNRSNPLLFVAISMIFYLGMLCATSIYMVSKADRKQLEKHILEQTKLHEMQKKFDTVSEELQELPQKKQEELYSIFSILKMGEKYLLQIDSLYESVIGEFILRNNITRHDGVCIGISQYKGGIIPPTKQYELNPNIEL